LPAELIAAVLPTFKAVLDIRLRVEVCEESATVMLELMLRVLLLEMVAVEPLPSVMPTGALSDSCGDEMDIVELDAVLNVVLAANVRPAMPLNIMLEAAALVLNVVGALILSSPVVST